MSEKVLASGWPADSTVAADGTGCSIDTDRYFSSSDMDLDRHCGDNILPDGELVAFLLGTVLGFLHNIAAYNLADDP